MSRDDAASISIARSKQERAAAATAKMREAEMSHLRLAELHEEAGRIDGYRGPDGPSDEDR